MPSRAVALVLAVVDRRRTLVVDGAVYTLNQTQPAKYLAWGDNAGVQWQMDVNASGTGYHGWVDRAKLTIW
jgi:hypothetical protein